MPRSWTHHIAAWLKRQGGRAAGRRARARRRCSVGGPVAHIESLEGRQMLTLLVGVHVSGNSIHLTEQRGGSTTEQDSVTISYTSSQVVLTGGTDTEFRVNGQTESTDTINITGPASISLALNHHDNSVNISGDGSSTLASLNVGVNASQQSNSITLSDVDADKINIHGGRSTDSVTIQNSSVTGNLDARLGKSSGDTLDLESTTIGGNLTDRVGALTLNGSTITGKLHNVEPGKDSTLTSSDTTYTGKATIQMGQSGVVNLNSANAGQNEFQSAVSFLGSPHNGITINQDPQSVFFSVTPKTRNATFNNTTPTLAAPTVNSQTTTLNTAPVITGTFDSVNTSVLTVAANGTTYTLGTNSQLTSPSAGNWSLNLGGATLTSPVTTVTVTSTDNQGNTQTGTGTITDGTAIINKYLQANNLTATTTADGLNYVITTRGTGATPAIGQTVSVDYSGFLLNSDGTLGTEFDSNTDSKFGHVTPFTFTLGAGQVIAGWDEAFKLLPVGTVAQLIIPSTLAYGTSGSGSSIPPNSILVFNVNVLSVS